MPPQFLRDGRLHLIPGIASGVPQDIVAAEVGGHDDHRVAEVDSAPPGVGQPAVVENLKQDIEDVGMRLFDLVEQDDGVRAPANGFGELAAFVVAHVSGRRAQQPRHRVLFHVLRHVQANHRPLVVEEEFGQSTRGFGLSDSGRAQEDERPDGTVGILQAGP